jgi:hypothetical protein
MANDALTLKYNVPVTVHAAGKNAANTEERSITGITGTPTHPQYVSIVAQGGGNFVITNNSPIAGNSGQINWSATNELGAVVTGVTQYTLMPADPAVTIEVKIIP